jgi:hypothetical protein
MTSFPLILSSLCQGPGQDMLESLTSQNTAQHYALRLVALILKAMLLVPAEVDCKPRAKFGLIVNCSCACVARVGVYR